MRADPNRYRQLDLRAHALLADVPLHDVWTTDLPGGGPGRGIEDLRAIVSPEKLTAASPAVRALFALRTGLGRLLGWNGEPAHAEQSSFVQRLSEADRAASRVAPGTPEGPFRVLYVAPREAISELQNPTVHAFSVFALAEEPPGYRLYWAIYVRPVGRITRWYMAAIDPFRRLLVYPAALRAIRAAWEREARASVG